MDQEKLQREIRAALARINDAVEGHLRLALELEALDEDGDETELAQGIIASALLEHREREEVRLGLEDEEAADAPAPA
jgi:hypothetical protein